MSIELMNVAQTVERELAVLIGNVLRLHFIHEEYMNSSGTVPEQPRWDAGD
jgi:hypothetical protein